MDKYLKRAVNIRMLGTASTVAFGLLLVLAISPIIKHTDSAEGASNPSTTTLTLTSPYIDAKVDLMPTNKNGTFAKSSAEDMAQFEVITDNYTGYTLNISAADDSGLLTNTNTGDTLTTITSAISESTFDNSSYNGYWGYQPSKYNTSTSSWDSLSSGNYLPSPTTIDTQLDVTTTANSTANRYAISLGARADYTKPVGTYTNTFMLQAVTNRVDFAIAYSKGYVTDAVSDLPGSTTGTSDSTTGTVTLSSDTPSRTGYSFSKWCLGTLGGTTENPGTTCTGTEYSAGDSLTQDFIDMTTNITNNTLTIYATWTPNNYTCTKQYRLQAANGNYPSAYTNDGTEQVAYNNTCSYSKTVTDYNSNAAKTTTCTITTDGCTAQIDFPRTTYKLTVNRNSTYLSAASGGGTYRWGQSVSISATTSSSNFTGWSVSSGSTGTFANANNASTTYTMPKGASTIYANGDRPAINSFTKSNCSSRASSGNIWVYDARDDQYYTVRYINGGCWMTRNLAIGCNGSGASYNANRKTVSLTSSNSNVSTTWSTGSAGALTSGATTAEARMQCNKTYGAWYNFAAASAGTITGDNNSTNASKDICPKNWRLPNNTEQNGLTSSSNSSAYSPVAGGYYGYGSLDETNSGRWWAATAYDEINRYGLVYRGSTMIMNGVWRLFGFYTRCIRTS